MLSQCLNIKTIGSLISSNELKKKLATSAQLKHSINIHREQLIETFNGNNDKLVVIVGPCSIHDSRAALQFAIQLKEIADCYKNTLKIVMRTYFEKPRSVIGWKGYIHDPQLDGSCQFNQGIFQARKLLMSINDLGLATGCEVLNSNYCPYYIDLISWSSIGARTVDSQPHRELASSLPCPVGFKNSIDGNIDSAISACLSSKEKHIIHERTEEGEMISYETQGNSNSHIILRGGKRPNYHSIDIINAHKDKSNKNVTTGLMIDCSHGNSLKNYKNQNKVAKEVARQIAAGCLHISGVMLESFLVAGSQPIAPINDLTYGKSITDQFIDIEETAQLLKILSSAVLTRRHKQNNECQIKKDISA